MKLVILGLMALLVPVEAPAQSAGITPEERAQAEASIQRAGQYLAQTMRDPSSASFRNVFLYKRVNAKPGMQVTVCGEVNARNGYGGLTGYQMFMISGERVYVGTSLGFQVSYLCQNNNPAIDTHDYSSELRASFDAALIGAAGK
ncbi:hypothetical protein [Sphingopyxis flava]|uniref:Uncharacterized protein n=1 Tax=Sphingopyxis flava TaxID=1507287 RepID=A0A1T5FIH8_9SPHN|nr:hypothetical protein [Sphingopyxis flava]SKB95917.1 hypothetical protein SAMN06295937_103626 [Sphingopyxis flava]